MKETNIHSKTVTNKTWNQVEGRFDHSFVFGFQTKAEYLEFRGCWKANYATLSQSIRGLKASVKATMRQREYAGERCSCWPPPSWRRAASMPRPKPLPNEWARKQGKGCAEKMARVVEALDLATKRSVSRVRFGAGEVEGLALFGFESKEL
jgi:hypothetical protein